MPCLNPIHIKQPSHTFANWLGLHDATSFKAYDVPCGKCAWCLKQKRNSYYLRSLHEYNKCNFNALFVTLTYDSVHLPLTEVQTKEPIFKRSDICPDEIETLQYPEYTYVSHWYKPHVQKFLKALNEKLIYFIGHDILKLKRLAVVNGHRVITDEWKNYLSNSSRPLRYLVTCERGKADIYVSDSGHTRVGTARPHYHALLFLNDMRLYPYHNKIIDFIKTLWVYGSSYSLSVANRNNVSKNDDRTPEQCISYVCKYITKDLKDSALNIPFLHYRHKRNSQPFTLISKFFGSSLLDNMTDDEIVKFVESGYTTSVNGSTFTLSIPQYNINRLSVKTHRYPRPSGFITKKSVKNPDLDVYYHPDNQGFYFLTQDDLDSIPDYHKCKDFVTIREKLPLYYKLQFEQRNRKATFYADTLLHITKLKPTFLWYLQDYPLSNRDIISDYDIMCSTSPDDLYQFILDDLYINTDRYSSNDILYQCYNIIRLYLSSLSKYDIDKREVTYKLNLPNAVSKVPNLFNVHPL